MAQLDVDESLKKLSLRDKVLLLSGSDAWHTHPVPSLDIPRVRVSDGPNGIRGIKFFGGEASNCFPCATGLAASWDVDLLEKLGKQMGEECRAKGAHVWLGPTLNIQRSPLGGRGFESYSEDPLLSGKMSAASIRGCQSTGVAATPKHFVCNEQELDRNSNDSQLSERALREIYLKAFQIAIREGKPWALMTAYNRVNGVHCSENRELLQDILRKEWAWDGMTMSDWYGTYSTSEALEAGLNLEMPGPPTMRGQALLRYFVAKKIAPSDLDFNVRKVLEMINRAKASGIPFDIEEKGIDDEATRGLLLTTAKESNVLLKNQNDVLPIKKEKVKKLAVIGPNAKVANISGGGSAGLKPIYTCSPLQGIKVLAEKHGIEVTYSVGAHSSRYLPLLDPYITDREGKKGHARLQFFEKDPDVEPCEPVYTMSADTTMGFMFDGIPDFVPPKVYMRLETLFTPDEDGEWEFGLGLTGQGKIFVDGQPVVSNYENRKPGDLFFQTGTIEERGKVTLKKGVAHKVLVTFNNFNPLMGFDLAGRGGFRIGAEKVIDEKQAIIDAVQVATEADAVIVIAGLSADFESESFDRPDMKLQPGVDEMVAQVLGANARSCVVLQSGTPCEMPWYDYAAAVIQAFYGGNEIGNGLAAVLFGEHNPSSKLPLTIPLKLEDYPSHPFFPGRNGKAYYNEDVFVAYRSFVSKTPKAPVRACFGHGLSYTTFDISAPSSVVLSHNAQSQQTTATVEVAVKNTGKLQGGEVVQCYISPAKCPLPRPSLELAAFAKVILQPEENKTVKLALDRSAFSYWDTTREHGTHMGCWVVEAGKYHIHVGNSLDNLPHIRDLEIKEGYTWIGL